ncbi:ATP-dependent DNA helicase RecG [Paenalcaligenes hominis]|uniref:ATP-dependent DNA helicase RecG n=1 Tax=Paenalcaligenes hominis TaxID=643674 RepID=UPI003524CB89
MADTTQKKTSKKPTQAQLLERLGLVQDMDFIVHLPLRYEDQTQIHEIATLAIGEYAQIEGTVVQQHILQRPRKQLQALVRDHTGELLVRLLHFYPNQINQFAEGNFIRLRGEVRRGFQTAIEMVHPKVSQAGAPLSQTLTPIYPTTEGLTQPSLRKAILAALDRASLTDTLSDAIRQRYGLLDFASAVTQLHYPAVEQSAALLNQTHPAWDRIKFDELLAQQLSLTAARARRALLKAPSIAPTRHLATQLEKKLGFQLTQAQQRVIAEISTDLQRHQPMNRLLQGDVGSGKTIVAAFAALQALEHGFQVALMAPTELLAEQHQQKLNAWLEPLGIQVDWLSGSLTPAQKRHAHERVATGASQLIVGTQALIQEAVQFHRLGLVILDEQHRFGVEQRLALSRKGTQSLQDLGAELLPHQLNMSATPIPRTLALTFYSDLDVSVIDELPPGRTPIQTKLLSADRRLEMMDRVRLAVQEGQQVYWVCPLVEESEALQLETAVDTYEQMALELAPLRVGLLHGRMSATEKHQVMEAFRAAELDVLVATTVIEVGVDVPNATIMVIEHAERYGLAQLHQLRGRVGRGHKASFCVLMYQPPLSAIARERLRAMYETTDGFEIAQRDLTLRGPGEFLGVRQSGQMLLRFANLDQDSELIHQAKECAAYLYQHHPDQAAAHVLRWLGAKEEFLRG